MYGDSCGPRARHNTLKIPFARRIADSELVEVGDVPAGRDCQCACPSCGLGVLAKKGDIKEWHFAHDSRSKIPPTGPCDASFHTCCRAFVLDQVTKTPSVRLRTPDHQVEEKRMPFSSAGLKELVTCGTLLDPSELSRDNRFDLVASVSNRKIFIHLDHPGRKLPDTDGLSDAGLLSISLTFMAEKYREITSQPELLKKLTVLMFEQETDCKQWLYHPREAEVRAKLRQRLETEWPELDNYILGLGRGSRSKKGRKAAMHLAQQSRPEPSSTGRAGSFSCALCDATWTGFENVDRTCHHCNSHLGSRFTL